MVFCYVDEQVVVFSGTHGLGHELRGWPHILHTDHNQDSCWNEWSRKYLHNPVFGKYIYRITAILKVETDIIANISESPIGQLENFW
jgi:hypothetical protein